uniref:ATP synthase-coupling factor 6, mitochondrial n=1 Tax=Panagrolaimus superbus TaxID=310955 RepID=A0A914Y2L9_9BILA
MLRVAFQQSRSLGTSAVRAKENDLIAQAFVKQIRDLAAKQKSAGGLVNTSPEIKKSLDEQLNRLANKFQLANAEVVSKLNVQIEKANVESSVGSALEGKTLDQMLADVKREQDEYLKEREQKKAEEKKREAAFAAASSNASSNAASSNAAPSNAAQA